MFFRLRRFVPFLIVPLCLFLISITYNLLLQEVVPRLFGNDGPTEEQLQSGEDILPDLRVTASQNAKASLAPKVDYKSPYPVGKTKAAGSNYTKTLVVARLKNETTTWIEDELGDLIDNGQLKTAVYTVDDSTAEFHPPKNKGHEAMVYLSYIIDHYEDLPDVSIFMHSHRFSWHNNELLEEDASKMVRYLSPERVSREGYMNLRCHTDPGCPEWLHPGNTRPDEDKPEEILMAASWSELFPMHPVPTVLAQPCCAQFAVSRDRIRETNKIRYIFMRDWLLRTELTDYISGRIFEYTWQFIFTGSPINCPSMTACYCDGYGLCFGDEDEFAYYLELIFDRNELEEELRIWNVDTLAIEESRGKGGWLDQGAKIKVPEAGRDEALRKGIEACSHEMQTMWDAAFERGKDPRQRALESGRDWNEGDGY